LLFYLVDLRLRLRTYLAEVLKVSQNLRDFLVWRQSLLLVVWRRWLLVLHVSS